MNLIDGLVRGRSIIPDAAGASKSGGPNGVAPQVGQDASFGDVLSRVSKGDGGAGQSSVTSFRETASGRNATGESGLRLFNEGGARAISENGEPPAAANASAGRAYIAAPSNDAAPFANRGAGVEAQLQALQASEANIGPNGVRAAHPGSASAGAEAAAKNAPSRLCSAASGADTRGDFEGTDIDANLASTAPSLSGVAARPAGQPNGGSAKSGGNVAAPQALTTVGTPSPSHRLATGASRPDKSKVTSRADPAPSQTSTESGLDAIFTLAGLVRTAAQGETPSMSELGRASPTFADARLLRAPQSTLPISVQGPQPSAISPLVPAGQTSAALERGRIKVALVDQQTHLPPVVDASPIRQIADRIAGEAGSAFASSAEGAEPGASSNSALPVGGAAARALSQAPPSVVRSLNLQLEPESLGAVTIRMRLSGARLAVQVEAANADTMRLIGGDKDRLAERLQSSGYAMDSLVVKIAESQTVQMQHGHGAAQTRKVFIKADRVCRLYIRKKPHPRAFVRPVEDLTFDQKSVVEIKQFARPQARAAASRRSSVGAFCDGHAIGERLTDGRFAEIGDFQSRDARARDRIFV